MITVTTAPNWFEVRVICFCYLQFFLLFITLVVIVVATIFLPILTLAPILTFSLICFEHLYDSISFLCMSLFSWYAIHVGDSLVHWLTCLLKWLVFMPFSLANSLRIWPSFNVKTPFLVFIWYFLSIFCKFTWLAGFKDCISSKEVVFFKYISKEIPWCFLL